MDHVDKSTADPSYPTHRTGLAETGADSERPADPELARVLFTDPYTRMDAGRTTVGPRRIDTQ
jgi:hypothetical protein